MNIFDYLFHRYLTARCDSLLQSTAKMHSVNLNNLSHHFVTIFARIQWSALTALR